VHVDPLDEKLDDPRVLGREQLVPDGGELSEENRNLALGDLVFAISLRRRPGPGNQLRCGQQLLDVVECALAGRGDLAAGFIAKATAVADVRRALLEARAAEDEATAIRSHVRSSSLNLVETTARGAPAIQNTTNKRKARSLVVPHIALEDTILADEVQNVRAFGSESMLEGVQAVVNQRMSEMATKMDATLEHLRIGAIKGQILDADGSAVIYDLFTEFGVTAYTEIDFDLDNASPAAGAVKKKCHDVRRKIEDELGAAPYDHIHAICGADFFDERDERVQDHERDRDNRRPRFPGFGDPLDPLDREVKPRHRLLDVAQPEAERDESSHRRRDPENYEERLP
jgi:hypothetical protein